MFNACYRLLMRKFVHSLTGNLDTEYDGSGSKVMRAMLDKYHVFVLSWEESLHGPSRMVELFLKSMRTYLRCEIAIATNDSWYMEIESASLLPIWKMNSNYTYFRLQCEYMETYYNVEWVSPFLRETMRANTFCVNRSGHAVAFDEQNESYDLLLKRTPPTSSIDIVVARSRHVIVADKAAKELWGLTRPRASIRGSSLEDDIIMIETILCRFDIFNNHEAVAMHTNYFWENIDRMKIGGTQADRYRTNSPFSEHEEVLLSVVRGEVSPELGESGITENKAARSPTNLRFKVTHVGVIPSFPIAFLCELDTSNKTPPFAIS
jgi:hypothetical protein